MKKIRFKNCILALLLGGAVLSTSSAFALSARRANELRKEVTSVPVPEMPAKAAQLVQEASGSDRKQVAITVVRAIVSKRKASGPVVVAAISKIAPDLAATVAAVANQIVGDQTSNIAQAAISAAPGESAAIRAAMSAPIEQVTGNQANIASALTSTSRTSETTPNPTGAPSVSTETPANVTIPNVAPEVGANSANINVAVPSARPTLPPTSGSPLVTGNTAAPLARGEADGSGSSGGTITHSINPIDSDTGGRGDGNFPTFKPTTAPTPQPKDYSKPRS